MQSLKKYYFGKQKAKVNTYIGGIGGTINTPALLASKLGVSESRIKLFKVTGVDVECAIVGGSYNLKGGSAGFRGNLAITYFEDREGLIVSTESDALSGYGTSDFNLKFVSMKNLQTINGLLFSYRLGIETFFAPKVTSINGSFNFNRTNLKNLYFPELLQCGDYAFANETISLSNQKRIVIPKCTLLGSSVLLNNVFGNIKSGCVIYANPFLQTNNSGAADGDLQNAISQGAIVRYVTNFTTPNAITNLSAGQIYNTAVQLNFTPPSSTNAIDFYEVYLNNSIVPYAEITASGQFVAGLTSSINYNITVVAVDIFYNKSVVSNVINVSTSNGIITDLSASILYNNAVFFNFTPKVYNTISYKWYSNGVLISTTAGKAMAGLTPNTTYTNITVRAVDAVYGEMTDSNVVASVTTTNILTDTDANNYATTSANTSFQYPINDVFKMAKDFALYPKIQAFYPFLGTTQAQHKWNAKNPLDTNAAFRLVFSGGGTHSNLGYQCNGTNAYANTFLVPSAVQNVNSNGLTVVVGTNNFDKTTFSVEIGAENSVTQASLIYTSLLNTNRSVGCDFNAQANRINLNNYNKANGIFSGSKTASNVHKLFRNGNILGSGAGGGTLPSIPFWIGKLNLITSPTTGYSNQRIQFVAIHEGLTDIEVQTLHTIIDAFETAISRKTW